jgi:urocanate hydratase
MVIDGSSDSERRLSQMLHWDVNNGIARRSWARNPSAMSAITRAVQNNSLLKVTMPNLVDDNILNNLLF